MKAFLRKFLGPVEFFRPFQPSTPHHLYAIQFFSFLYMLYRFSSRDYAAYGFLDESAFQYPREFLYELWPFQLSRITTFHFVYWIFPRPGEEGIHLLQFAAIGASLGGLLGLFPRFCALAALLLGSHLLGFAISSNADIDGGTLGLMSLLVLALAGKGSLYSLGRPLRLKEESAAFRWPVFLFLFVIATYYFCTGLNKWIDVGPMLPFDLHLEWMAENKLRQAYFVSYRYLHPEMAQFLYENPGFSVLGGFCTLLGEIGMVGILFLPRWRALLVGNMIAFHVLVFFAAGINFLGNAVTLSLCLDWGRRFRAASADEKRDGS